MLGLKGLRSDVLHYEQFFFKLLIKAIAHESKYLQMISIRLKSMYELKLKATVMNNFI